MADEIEEEDSGDLTVAPTPPEDNEDDRQEERGEELSNRTALSEVIYAQAMEASIAHALLPRPPVAAGAVRNWYATGPRNIGGRITALAQDPRNAQLIYAGSAHGGLWRSIDRGETWHNISPRDLSVPIGTIAIPDTQPDVLYVGTGSHKEDRVSGRGIYRVSVPGPRATAVFAQLAGTDPPTTPPANAVNGASYRYHRIAVDPDDATRFWAASQTGLWRFKVALPPAAPAPAITQDFPPNPLPVGFPALSTGPIPLPGNFQSWPQYATDVAVCRDPNDNTRFDNKARYLLIFVGIFGAGVFRAQYDRQTDTLSTPFAQLVNWNPALPAIGRVRLSLCRDQPQNIYAVFSDGNSQATAVYASNDAGNNWNAGAALPAAINTGQADYDLVLEVNPNQPRFLICGVIDIAKSEDSGATWTQIADWQYYDMGDQAQHADQHAAHFDTGDRRRVLCGNDGGLQVVDNVHEIQGPAPLRYWRKRSHGLNAAQFQSLAVNGNHAFMGGCGLQDNGSWWGLGGETWYRVGWADGGGFAFHRGDPRRHYPAQNGGFNVSTVVNATQAPFIPVPMANFRGIVSTVAPELASAPAPWNFPGAMQVRLDWAGVGGPFVPIVEEDPTTPGRVLYGSIHDQTAGPNQRIAFRAGPYAALPAPLPAGSINPTPAPTRIKMNAAAVSGVPDRAECTAIEFGPTGGASIDVWIGTSSGHLLLSTSGANGTFRLTGALPNPSGAVQNITDISVHPRDARIAAVSVVPNVRVIVIRIATAGATGTARFSMSFDGTNFVNTRTTAANVAVPGTVFTVSFVGNFVVGDRWGLFPDGTVTAAGTNTSPGVFSARPNITSNANVVVRITTAGAVGAAQFSYQVGANPVVGGNTVRANFSVPGTLITLLFGAGNYVAADSWTVSPAAAVAAAGGNTSAGVLTARNWFGGRVYLTFNKGANWQDVTETFTGPNPETHSLPASPVPCLLFDPLTPAAANDPIRLFAGTLAGVYALQNVPSVPPAAGTAINVDWQPFSSGLPLALVNDMRAVPGTSRMRIATYGRGLYEIELAAAGGATTTPDRRLYLRQTLIEDGRSYPRRIPTALRDDPRLPRGAIGLDFAHAFDIRIDAAPLDFFDDRVDPVEFDERLGVDLLQPRRRNNVYVQVHNSGLAAVPNARVHLFFCAAAAAAPLAAPPALPSPAPATLQPALPAGLNLGPIADFYRPANNFEPPAGATWRRVAPPQPIAAVAPGEPVVVRFEWQDPPAALAGGNVALLALVDAPGDNTWPGAPADYDALVRQERRVALRIAPVAQLPPPSIYIRDGVDDTALSLRGTLPVSGRSPDIIVSQEALPASAFGDLLDMRPQQRLRLGQANRVYVRVHNRGAVDTTAEVELWAIPLRGDNQPDFDQSHWTQLTRAGAPPPAISVAVTAGNFAITDAVEWTPTDPDPSDATQPLKSYWLLALIKTADNSDPMPARTRLTAAAFWNVVGKLADSENVALRALRVIN